MSRPVFILLLLAGFLVPAPFLSAQEVSPTELKLREALRNTALQLRSVEGERARLDAELQALKVQSEKQISDLKLALAEAAKQANEDKIVSDQTIKQRSEALAVSEARAAALAASLDKWMASHAQVVDIARRKEAERVALKVKTLELDHLVKDRERKNLELYRTGKEILERYESFGLGKAIAAREPFTGLAKVKLETQVQDYRHQLDDGFVNAGEPPSTPAPDAAPPAEAIPSGPTAEVAPAEPQSGS